MTREEQIRKKAKELGQQYFPDSSNIWARSNVEACYVENACVEMAEWLDQRPHWIPVEEELPKEKGKYMFRLSNCDMCYETYYPKLKLLDNVTHWMPIVPPRKEEVNE